MKTSNALRRCHTLLSMQQVTVAFLVAKRPIWPVLDLYATLDAFNFHPDNGLGLCRPIGFGSGLGTLDGTDWSLLHQDFDTFGNLIASTDDLAIGALPTT